MATAPLPASAPAINRLEANNRPGGLTKQQQAARTAAEEFEQTFLTTMLSSMFAGVKTSAPFGGGHAEEQFRSVLLGEYAKDMAKTGGIGIADEVYREILAIQEGKA
ncbi:MAG: rod-binding protein [Hyphomicrobiaceae bacterium]|nr:rod-binding protein [Hyphomicrobiaceae bacterium]